MKEIEVLLPVPPGAVIAGRYRVDGVIGAGGMGIVLGATHLQLEQPVAIKILQPHALANPEIVARFVREARAAVRIESEHVTRVLDVGSLDSGAPYMVMERLEGCDLAALLRAKGRMPIALAVDYVLQALEAIGEAHSRGIIHRDLKPANLFLVTGRRAETVKVLDFGISKTISSSGSARSGMTHTSEVFGTPAYMSPEQLNSARNVDARSDIWSLGVILYELLAGQAPFRAETMPQLCVAILNHPAPALRSLRDDVPTELEAVVQRCLQKDRADRFAGADQLAMALASFADPRSRASVERAYRPESGSDITRSSGALCTLTAAGPPESPGIAYGESLSSSTQSDWGATARDLRGRSRWRLFIAVAMGAVAAAAIVAAKLFAMTDVEGSQAPGSRSAESASPPSANANAFAPPPVEQRMNASELAHPASASTGPVEVTAVPLPITSAAPRSSSIIRRQRVKKMPAGSRGAPAATGGVDERRLGSTEGWEDER